VTVTPAATPPTPPAQEGQLSRLWYWQVGVDNAAQVAEDWQANLHGDEMRTSHQSQPSEAEMVDRGVTPASGG
jgi:hypothetical protein